MQQLSLKINRIPHKNDDDDEHIALQHRLAISIRNSALGSMHQMKNIGFEQSPLDHRAEMSIKSCAVAPAAAKSFARLDAQWA